HVLSRECVVLRMAVRPAAADERPAADVEDVQEPDEIEEERVVAPPRERLDPERLVVRDRGLAEAGRASGEGDVLVVRTEDLAPHLLDAVRPGLAERDLA